MIIRSLLLGLLLTTAAALDSRAQATLTSLVGEANAEWLLGTWEGTTDNGSTVSITFSSELNQNIALLHIKAEGMEAKGYTFVEPGRSRPSYIGFDNRGTVSHGTWDEEAGELVLRLESKGTERNRKMAAVFTGSTARGLEVRIHGINDSGALVYPAGMTLKCKKQK